MKCYICHRIKAELYNFRDGTLEVKKQKNGSYRILPDKGKFLSATG